VREARNRETIRTFAPDLPEDRWDRAVFSRSLSGLAIGIALLCLTFGAWAGLAAGAVHAVLYVFVLAPLINGLGHWRGAQNFGNTAYNSKVLAWVTGGESLHNNHHAYPRAPKFSMRRFEFDPSWVVIRGLAALRLLRIVGKPQVVDGESEGRPLESTAGAGQLARAGGSAGRARHANRRVNQKERTGRVITR